MVFKFVYLQEAHPEDEWTNKKVEPLVLQHHSNITERIKVAEKLIHDLGVKGQIFVDTLDNSFSASFNAWPAKCFVIKKGSLVFTCGLLGFKNEEKSLGSWLEKNLLQNPPEIPSRNPSQTIRMKTVLVGDKSCGKTSLYIRFGKNTFPTAYIPSVFEHYVADMEVDNQQVEIALWDTVDKNGEDDFARLRPLSYPDTDTLLLMFSFGSAESLQNCSTKWLPELTQFCPGVPIVLVGGKKDLMGSGEVTTREGREMAENIGAVEYVEASAKTGEGVEEVFIAAVRHRLVPRPRNSFTCPCDIL